MYVKTYIEIDVICLIILLFVIYKVRRLMNKQTANIRFLRVLSATALLLVLDIVWVMIANEWIPTTYGVSVTVNSGYLFLTGVVSYCWLLYSESKLGKYHKNYVQKILYIAPLLFLLLVCIATYWTKWLFSIENRIHYIRGAGYPIQLVVAYAYLFFAAGEALYYAVKEKNKRKRGEYCILFSFILLPAIGGIVEASSLGIPTSWPGATLSFLMVYVNFQEHQIITDGLTTTNNRRNFDEYMQKITSMPTRSAKIYFILIDINFFKKINDTYGHYEGDLVLQEIANILKEVSDSFNAFLARYGGDEFAIICQNEQTDCPQLIREQIQKALGVYNKKHTRGYQISLSIGTSEFDSEQNDTIAKVIERADKNLYVEKAYYHQNAEHM